MFFFFCPDGITPNSGLTGPNNTHTHTHTHTYIYIYIYIYIYVCVCVCVCVCEYTRKYFWYQKIISLPVGWGCGIHQLHLYGGVDLPSVNVLDMSLRLKSHHLSRSLRNEEYPFIAIAPTFTLVLLVSKQIINIYNWIRIIIVSNTWNHITVSKQMIDIK